jgi:hypothetical protein
MNNFDTEFRSKFENSNRSYAHVSFGYETSVYIPMDIISKYEMNNSTLKNNDKLAKFIVKIITELMSKIK